MVPAIASSYVVVCTCGTGGFTPPAVAVRRLFTRFSCESAPTPLQDPATVRPETPASHAMSRTEETMNQPEMTNVGFDDEEVFDNDVGEENTEEAKFDEMIGLLQDILIDPEFVDMQSDFCRNNCETFDNVSENKLIYMDIFQQYTDLIETFIEQRLHEKLEYFSMDELCNQIQEHEDEIPLDVIDVLLSCSDFEEFKSLMLSFKQNEMPCIEITGDALICCSE